MPNIKAGGITARINVDTVDARANINQLKRSVRQLNTRFRDSYRSQMMAGHAQEALKTKTLGALEQYHYLRHAITQVNGALKRAYRLHQSGTKNYRAAELDLQNLIEWRKRAERTIEHGNHLLILHNDSLRQSMETERHNLEIGKQKIAQYEAEGQRAKANNQILETRKQHLEDVKNVTAEYDRTMRKAEAHHINNAGDRDYDQTVEGAQHAKQVQAELRREIDLDDSHLKALNRTAQDERGISQSIIQKFKAENNSVMEHTAKVKDLTDKLRQLKEIRDETTRDVVNAQFHDQGNSDRVKSLIQKMYRLRAATSSTEAKLHDLNNNLTSGQRYDQLYNQSTNSLVNSLRELRGKAQAGRIQFQLLTDNIHHESSQLVKQEQEVKRVAAANQTKNDTTGHASLAYQRENAKLMALNATYSKHRKLIEDLSQTYGQFSLRSARSIDKLTERIKTNDRSAHNWLRTAHAMTNGSIALGAAFYYGAKQAVGLDNEFNKISVLARNNNESISTVRRNVRGMTHDTADLAEKYGVSQQKISGGLETLIRRGYSSGQALHSMKYYLQASTASGEDLTDVIHTAGSTLEGFGLKSGDIGKHTKVVTNEMAAAADYTASSFHDMGVAMAYTGPIAKSTNQSVSETSSALGELANKGIKGSMAGTSLRRILQNIAGFKPNNKVLKSMGLSSKDFQGAHGRLKNLSQIMGMIGNKIKGMSSAKQTNIMQQLFGRYGASSATILANNAAQVGNLTGRVKDAVKNGYTSKTSQQNMNTTEGQLLRLKQSGSQLAKEYAEGLMPVFSKTADAAIALSKVLTHMPTGVKDITAAVTLGIPAVAGFAYAIATVRKAISVYQKFQRNGLQFFYKSDDELRANSGYYEKHTTQVDNDTNAIQNHNKAVDEAITLSNRLNDGYSGSSQATQEDTEQTDVNTKSKENNARGNSEDSESENGVTEADRTNAESKAADTEAGNTETAAEPVASGARSVGGRVLKSSAAGIGMGAMVGGIDAANGHPGKGVADGVGTAGGTVVGTGLAGPIGGAIGSVVGPMLVHAVSNGYSKEKKRINHHGSYKMKNPMDGVTDDDVAQAAKRYAKSYASTFNSMNKANRRYVWNLQKVQHSAELSYINHRGKMTNAQKGYYNSMYNSAAAYEKDRISKQRDHLRELYKDGYLTKAEYKSENSALRKSQTNKLAKLKRYEQAVINASGKSRGKRKEALKKFDKDLLTMTHTSASKRKRILKRLLGTASKISASAYRKIKENADRTYNSAVNSAKNTYGRQKALNKQHYNSAVAYAAKIYGVHSTAYTNAVSQAKAHETQMNNKARGQEKKTESHAENQKNGVINAAKSQRKETVDNANKQSSGIQSVFSNLWSGIKHLFSGSGKKQKITKDTTFANGTPDTQALHFAAGNLPGISNNENAVVNDGSGRELVKLPNGQMVLPSGHNVHTILPKGTSVFNAMQTRHLLSALAPAVHHADGTVAFASGSGQGRKNTVNVKTPDGDLKKTTKNTKKSMKNIHDILAKGYKKTRKDSADQLDKFHDHNNDSWDDTKGITQDHIKDIHDDTLDRFKDMKNGVNDIQNRSNQLTNTHLGTTVSYFRKHFNMIPPLSRGSMQRGVSNINSGIAAIDRILRQFGGNSHVLGMVHYATGTSTPSLERRLAVLNDANSGPSQEAIVSDQGRVRMPVGRNAVAALNPGDKVLNGSDTLRAIRTGLIPHYASGKNSNEALQKLAEHNAKYPKSFISNTFDRFARTIGDVLSKDMTADSKQGGQAPADRWSGALWKYVHGLLNDATSSSAILNYAEKHWMGVPYSWSGGESRNSADCGGAVKSIFGHFGIGLPHVDMEDSPALRFIGKSMSNAQPGDLVMFGSHGGHKSGYNSHVGIYAGHGQMWNETPPHSKISPVSSGYGDGLWGYWRAKAARNTPPKSENTPLMRLIKGELGGRAIKNLTHIGSELADFAGGDISNPGGFGVKRWRNAVVRALKALHYPDGEGTVQRVLRQITTESGGNPSAVGGTDGLSDGRAMGLMQVKPGTFAANAPKNGKWNNGYDSIFAGLKYAMGRYGSLGVLGNGHGYKRGGLSIADKMAHISEGNKPEMVLPLTNRSRAVELMLRSLQYMFGNDSSRNNQNNAGQNQQSNEQALRDRRFEQELIESNRHKDKLINNILNKMTLLIQTVQNKPVISDADIYRGNRRVTMNKARLRNFNRGTF